ncbi:hypothetical protein [Marinicella meishanensis]|uniref:hypothetical protein n=1 Tax=Marinicella meishanensis TaxID=2873263 RepID=UPI001CBC610D|nr:hypothetical protein [Marinicella sp. NBU2979]
MSKIKASLTHFLLSALFITTFFLFAYFIWYQQVFFKISGVIEPLKLLLIVDVILGPLLTFIIYKEGKKNLKFDLMMIVLFQIMAFIYGAHSVYLGKPSLVIHRTGYLEVISENDINYAELSDEMKLENYWFRPIYGKIEGGDLTPISDAKDYLYLVTPFDRNQISSFSEFLSPSEIKKTFENSTSEIKNRIDSLLDESDEYIFYELNYGKLFGVLIINRSGLNMQEILMP